MPTMTWPRTITRGPLKGRVFVSQAEYQKEITRLKNHPSSINVDDYYFEFTLVKGSVKFTVIGDPRKGDDVDQVLDILAKYGSDKEN